MVRIIVEVIQKTEPTEMIGNFREADFGSSNLKNKV